jgi:tRNA (mo5U34)-methyltransferase
VGTYDGFLAFELERRGAAEVVATDLADPEQWDWPPRVRAGGVAFERALVGPRKGAGFEIARDLLGSRVGLEHISVYDLSPERVGEFDVVVCGSLLLHLRDPVGAIAAIRSLCRERFLCTNQVDLRPWLYRKRPLARLDGGLTDLCQWWLPNPAAHRQMVRAGGFEIERESRLYAIPFGQAHSTLPSSPRRMATKLVRRLLAGGDGVPHHAVLAVPTG